MTTADAARRRRFLRLFPAERTRSSILSPDRSGPAGEAFSAIVIHFQGHRRSQDAALRPGSLVDHHSLPEPSRQTVRSGGKPEPSFPGYRGRGGPGGEISWAAAIGQRAAGGDLRQAGPEAACRQRTAPGLETAASHHAMMIVPAAELCQAPCLDLTNAGPAVIFKPVASSYQPLPRGPFTSHNP